LVRDYARELHAFAYRLCGNAADAEDLVQETFYHAWRSMHKLRESQKGRAWLFQILRYRCAHWRRDSGRRIQAKLSLDQVGQVSLSGLQIPEALSLRESLQQGLDALEYRYKEPFLMVFLEGLSCRATAEALEIPLGTVLSRIHRARSFLRDRLGDLAAAGPSEDRVSGEKNDKVRRWPPFSAGEG
jgi:RNA polymerase sigma-70 factor (ECF subfamily)